MDDGTAKSTLNTFAAVPWWKEFQISPQGDILGLLSWGAVQSLQEERDVVGLFLGWNLARAFEVVNGGVAVMDGFGAVYTFNGAPPAKGLPSFGWDIARDLEVLPGTGYYYILSGFGTLHTNDPAGPFTGPDFGWDIARDLEILPDASGGYVLDGYGGVAAVGGAPDIITPFFGWDIARDIELSPDGSGLYILDAFGGVHPCGGAAAVTGWNLSSPVAVDMIVRD